MTFDLTPLYRSAIGFDRLASMINSSTQTEQSSYPPYNIERLEEDHYRITMAVAGFTNNDLHIETEQNVLKVSGNQDDSSDNKREFLYRGIAERNFERRFQLADHVKVVGAQTENGVLHIQLVREVPQTMKPHTIEIVDGPALKAPVLENESAKAA